MRKMVRLTLVAGASAAVVGGTMLAAPSMAAPGGGECQLHGTANFHPGPGTDPSAAFAYDFGGDLSGCNASDAEPASGTISAGQTITIGGVTYQEPTPTGTGSCASGTTNGTSFVQWADGTLTIIKYSTTSAAAGVALQGSVLASTTLTPVGGGAAATVTSTRYVGDGAAGVLAFEVSDPTQCTASGGVVSAGIDGVTGLGSQ
jgi:hypothetical protein